MGQVTGEGGGGSIMARKSSMSLSLSHDGVGVGDLEINFRHPTFLNIDNIICIRYEFLYLNTHIKL